MLDTEQGKSLDEILERRRFVLEIVLIPISLAISINVFTSFLIDGFAPGNPNANWSFFWALMSGLITAAGVIVAIFILTNCEKVEKDGFTVLIPLWIDRKKKQAGILENSDYDPSVEGHSLFQFAGKEFSRQFADQCPTGKFVQDPSFKQGHLCWDGLMALMEALLLTALKDFSERTTGHAPFYHGWSRRLTDLLDMKENASAPLPPFLKSNRFLKARQISQIKTPFKLSFVRRRCEHLHDIRSDRQDMALMVHRSFLTFSISPHWSFLAKKNLQARLRIQFKPPDNVEVFWMVIPVEMCLEFNSTFFSKKKLLARNYLWLQKAMQQTKLHMSLGLFLRSDENASGERFRSD
jgi:hypothetical protein